MGISLGGLDNLVIRSDVMSSVEIVGIDFSSLDPIEVTVPIGGESYVLREASGDAACKYRNALLACTTLGPDGKPSRIVGMADVEPLLVSLCLFDSKGKSVDVKKIRSWPNRVQKVLYEKAKEISELDADDTVDSLLKQRLDIDSKLQKMTEEESVKNALSVTMDGSS